MKPKSMPPLTVGSLFTGIGGFDLGLEQAGMKVAWQSEVDKYASKTLACHWPEVPNLGDMNDIDPPKVDLICGGFPCQDISIAGNMKGLSGERSGLYYPMVELIDRLRPRWVLIENVANLLSVDGGEAMATVVGMLDDIGYVGEWRVLNSQGFGVPQRRRRVFLVGHLGDQGGRREVLSEPEGVRGDTATRGEAREEVVRAFTRSSLGGGGVDDNNAQAGHLIVSIAQNQRGEVNTSTVTQALSAGGGIPGQGYAAAFQHGRVRRLTPLECERLQGFPDHWTEGNSDTQRYRQLGNAVTVPVVEWIGRKIVAAS